nr:retrovirus-related Pol polyprotein from transposon TNT 1-94 [Tanacetum cinerariifolium]
MLIFSRASLFLWTEAIATTCFTQNRSIINHRFNKTPYELIKGRKPDISFLHVFGALCYPKNDHEDIGKLGAKGDIGFFIGYSADSCTYRVYNRRTKKIIETMNVLFNELSAMAFEQRSSKPRLQSMTSGQISSELDLTYTPSTITTQQPTEENSHLKATYKNLFDSISVSRAQTKTIIASLQNELQSNIYKNAKLRTQLFKKVSDQNENTQDTSKNTKFAKQPIVDNSPKIGETNALSNPVTSNSVSTPQESKGVNNDKVIAPGMFRINPSKTSREEKHMPNTVSKLENENVGLEFQVLNFARENAHLKTTYKNLFDSISVSQTQTKTIIASLQNKLQNTISKNAKLRAQLFKKVFDQKDNTRDTSANTKFAKHSTTRNLPKVGETHALSKPDTSNSIPTPQESKVVQNDKVIAPGLLRVNPFKTSREEKNVPNNVRASTRTNSIIVSQPSIITKKDVNSDTNGLSSTRIDNTKTRRP